MKTVHSITYTTLINDAEIQDILELQKQNHYNSVNEEEQKEQGFVTLKHDKDLLRKMNEEFGHVLAKDGEKVVGYALVMLSSFAKDLPALDHMFAQVNELITKGSHPKLSSYFVMGQVCIDKAYRGQGIFYGLYNKLRENMAPHFNCVVTEVSSQNIRSLKAHFNAGFKTIKTYQVGDNKTWHVIYWDWN